MLDLNIKFPVWVINSDNVWEQDGVVFIDNTVLDDLNQKATFFLNKLEKVKNTYNHLIEEIRGKGFLLGIKSKINNSIFIDKLRNNGLLIVGASENIIRILPPLNVTKKELKIALKIIEKTCKDINKRWKK